MLAIGIALAIFGYAMWYAGFTGLDSLVPNGKFTKVSIFGALGLNKLDQTSKTSFLTNASSQSADTNAMPAALDWNPPAGQPIAYVPVSLSGAQQLNQTGSNPTTPTSPTTNNPPVQGTPVSAGTTSLAGVTTPSTTKAGG